MEEVRKTLRHMVSKDKNRFVTNEVDLDLTYITDRIIAMGLPGEGVVAMWRNSLEEVARFLYENHDGHYCVFNLNDTTEYDDSKLQRVQRYGWPDHHAPNLNILRQLVQSIQSWLDEHPNNVAVVHCKAGRGRTGTVISSYLVHTAKCEPHEALDYFASIRSNVKMGVNTPSQRRYVSYIPNMQVAVGAPIKKVISRILIKPLPKITGGFIGSIEILNASVIPYVTIYSSPFRHFDVQNFEASLDMQVIIGGDVLVRVWYRISGITASISKNLLFRFAFHTSFITGNTLVLTRNEIEGEKSGILEDKRVSRATIVSVFMSDVEPPVVSRISKPSEEFIEIPSSTNVPPPINRRTKSISLAIISTENALNNLINVGTLSKVEDSFANDLNSNSIQSKEVVKSELDDLLEQYQTQLSNT